MCDLPYRLKVGFQLFSYFSLKDSLEVNVVSEGLMEVWTEDETYWYEYQGKSKNKTVPTTYRNNANIAIWLTSGLFKDWLEGLDKDEMA